MLPSLSLLSGASSGRRGVGRKSRNGLSIGGGGGWVIACCSQEGGTGHAVAAGISSSTGGRRVCAASSGAIKKNAQLVQNVINPHSFHCIEALLQEVNRSPPLGFGNYQKLGHQSVQLLANPRGRFGKRSRMQKRCPAVDADYFQNLVDDMSINANHNTNRC